MSWEGGWGSGLWAGLFVWFWLDCGGLLVCVPAPHQICVRNPLCRSLHCEKSKFFGLAYRGLHNLTSTSFSKAPPLTSCERSSLSAPRLSSFSRRGRLVTTPAPAGPRPPRTCCPLVFHLPVAPQQSFVQGPCRSAAFRTLRLPCACPSQQEEGLVYPR